MGGGTRMWSLSKRPVRTSVRCSFCPASTGDTGGRGPGPRGGTADGSGGRADEAGGLVLLAGMRRRLRISLSRHFGTRALFRRRNEPVSRGHSLGGGALAVSSCARRLQRGPCRPAPTAGHWQLWSRVRDEPPSSQLSSRCLSRTLCARRVPPRTPWTEGTPRQGYSRGHPFCTRG